MMYYETDKKQFVSNKIDTKESCIMCFENNGGCCWIIILLVILFCRCGGGNGCGCGGGCNNGCGGCGC